MIQTFDEFCKNGKMNELSLAKLIKEVKPYVSSPGSYYDVGIKSDEEIIIPDTDDETVEGVYAYKKEVFLITDGGSDIGPLGTFDKDFQEKIFKGVIDCLLDDKKTPAEIKTKLKTIQF